MTQPVVMQHVLSTVRQRIKELQMGIEFQGSEEARLQTLLAEVQGEIRAMTAEIQNLKAWLAANGAEEINV